MKIYESFVIARRPDNLDDHDPTANPADQPSQETTRLTCFGQIDVHVGQTGNCENSEYPNCGTVRRRGETVEKTEENENVNVLQIVEVASEK